MSYILDALKKSEQERTLGTVQTLNGVSSSAIHSTHKLVLVLVSVVLGLVVSIGGLGWYFREEISKFIVIPESRQKPGSSLEDRGVQNTPRVTGQFDSTRILTKPTDQQSTAENPKVEQEMLPTTNVDSTAKVPLPQEEPDSEVLPVSDLPPEKLDKLPGLAISVLSYSQSVDRRFVMLDGQIYKEGDHVATGLQISRIRPDRIELIIEGQGFYITP